MESGCDTQLLTLPQPHGFQGWLADQI